MVSPKQIITDLRKTIRRLAKQGKTIEQILESSEIKQLQHLYNTNSGFILNDYQLKRTIKQVLSPPVKSSKGRRPSPPSEQRKGYKIYKSRLRK